MPSAHKKYGVVPVSQLFSALSPAVTSVINLHPNCVQTVLCTLMRTIESTNPNDKRCVQQTQDSGGNVKAQSEDSKAFTPATGDGTNAVAASTAVEGEQTTKQPSRSGGSGVRGDVIDSDKDLLVVVTGGSKGIGKSCVESFARRGARVLFTFCSDADAAAKIEKSFEPPGRVQGRRLDQGDFESVQAFAAEVDRWREGRPVDTLVNNAALGVATVSAYHDRTILNKNKPANEVDRGHKGITTRGDNHSADSAATAEIEAARRRAEEDLMLMRVNALGPVWVTEALLPMMQAAATTPETKKTVLFVGSVGGGSQSVFPGFRVADAMSKAALTYACKHFAARRRRTVVGASVAPPCSSDTTADPGGRQCYTAGSTECVLADAPAAARDKPSEVDGSVDFLCLCPGATLTDMFRASTLDKLNGPGQLESFISALPQGRLILPQEVGETIQWLCTSPAASMFHGAVIDASAGLAVRPGVLTEHEF